MHPRAQGDWTRGLKPTGSLYLHCDPTASHYLKLLRDLRGVIERENAALGVLITMQAPTRPMRQKSRRGWPLRRCLGPQYRGSNF